MKRKKKIIWALIALIAALALFWLIRYLVHYYFYDTYKDYLTSYEVEEGSEFQPIKESSPDVSGMELVAENDGFKLYTKESTAEIAIYNKTDQTITYSNPPLADEDAVASGTNKNYLKSQIILEYFNSKQAAGVYDSYSMSVEKEQFQSEAIEEGIRYIYEFGDKTSTTGIVPIYIKEEKLNELLPLMSEEGAKYVRSRYRVSETLGEEYLELNESAAAGRSTLRKMNRYYEEAGFTEEDYLAVMESSGVEGAVPQTFIVAVEYRLTSDGLEVSVPMKLVQEQGGGKIYRIQLLNYFGAATTDEQGYMVVPNGSGSLIYFNNKKTNADEYSQYIYGIDPLMADYTVIENMEKARLPLFGICRENSSIMATIEDGKSLAYLTAGVAGKINSYNYAYPTFVLRGNEKLSMGGGLGDEVTFTVVEKDLYDVNLQVHYTFLTKENSGYSGIANCYRQRLLDEGKLQLQDGKEQLPLYYDIIGGVKQTDFFIGAQYLKVFPMTTFEEAGEIYEDLKAEGIQTQVMNYQGWFNGGYYHDVPDKIKIIRKLGGKSGLEELNAKLEADGSRLYGDVVFQPVSFVSKRFEYSLESSRYYGAGYVAYFGQVNPANLRQTAPLNYMETMYDLLSPKFLPRYVEKFSHKVEKLELSGISLRDLGDYLYSDKKRTAVIHREEALDVVLGQFERLSQTNKNLMVSGGNDYTFPYVTDILNAPIAHNDYFIVDEQIPLYEMVIQGCLDYSGDLINLTDSFDEKAVVLHLIETGASPHFVFTMQDSTNMKYTGLNRYYATTYSRWKDLAVSVYTQVNEALQYVNGAVITQHEILEDGVKKITYSNGVIIYINENKHEVQVQDLVIDGLSYELEGVK